jgi:hypothetical protein
MDYKSGGGCDLVSLTRFSSGRRRRKKIYYAFDSHWNAEGKEIAPRFVADTLKKQIS